jgi:ABC-2 type transport system permease protein
VIGDILTVATKEWKELFFAGGLLRGGKLSLVILLGMFGVFMPYQYGAAWFTSPGTLLYWAWIPLMIVAGAIADSFAGERERHTLETLLASRLPDLAILLGKMVAAVGYGWALVLAMLGLGLVTVQVTGPTAIVPWAMLLGASVMALLGSAIAAGAGVLVSLRSPTVRQAAQALNVAILLLVFVPVFTIQALPIVWRAELALWAKRVGPEGLVWSVALLMAMVAGVLLSVSAARFRRSRLILD